MHPKVLILYLCNLAVLAIGSAQTNALNLTGNVGIGTTTPSTSLQIVGPFTPGSAQLMLQSTGTDKRIGISFWSQPGVRSGIIYVDPAGDFILGKDQVGMFRFFSNGQERISINTLGNVGIGTVSPSARLDVQSVGASALRLYDGASDTSTIEFQRTSDGWKMGELKLVHAGNYGAGFSIKLHPNDGSMLSASNEVMTILSNGFTGIGTTNPAANLHVRSPVPSYTTPLLRIQKNIGSDDFSASQHGWQLELTKQSDGKSLAIGVLDNGVGVIQSKEAGVGYQNLALQPVSGNVGIGTTNPTQKLSVNGTVRAKEVIVETTGWSDYILAKGYTLQPLSSVEKQIERDGHLPGIPSASEVAENGISVGAMQAKLLAKIEELTLHQIALEKRINAQSQEIALLKSGGGLLKPVANN